MKKGFTLAEIMIVLSVIAVLTAILLPAARNAMPNEKIMKFKKGHIALYSAISELVNSDEYYLNGDLGVKTNGDWVLETDYFLSTFSNIINFKEKLLPESKAGKYDIYSVIAVDGGIEAIKITLDNACANKQNNLDNYILTDDKTYYFQYDNDIVFGADFFWFGDYRNPFYVKWNGKIPLSQCVSLPTKQEQDQCAVDNFSSGLYYVYSIFCLDIDEINKDEAPFGYGIRIDGKILNGVRADEWLAKSIQEKD